MAIRTPNRASTRFVDKQWLRQELAEMDAHEVSVGDAKVTAAQVREMMIADGVRPEENEFSRDIIRARYEDAS